MSFFSTNNPCPCESGLQHLYCCGAPDRTELNTIASFIDEGEATINQLTPELQIALREIKHVPDWFPVTLNLFKNYVQFVKMSPFWYQQSIFLDADRILGTCAMEADLKWLTDETKGIAWQATPFIFHTAFCGSTLMSKALANIYDSLPLREPEALGSLQSYWQSNIAIKEKKAWFDRVMGLLARRYEPEQIVVVKANDYVNALIKPLLEWHPDISILFMYTPLSEFLAGCLKDETRRQWIRERYHFIYDTAAQQLNLPDDLVIEHEAYGKMAAIYWCCNIVLYLQARQRLPQQLRSLDFNRMLAHPIDSVQACAQWFGLKELPDMTPAYEISTLFSFYSKGENYAYSSEKRREDINILLSAHPAQLEAAETLARKILGNDYPSEHLPGGLIDC